MTTTTDHRLGHFPTDNQQDGAEPVSTSLRATCSSEPNHRTPAGDQPASGQAFVDAQRARAAGSNLPADQMDAESHVARVGGEQTEDGSAATSAGPIPRATSSLADPFLALSADVLDDTENTRKANENRLRQLTRSAVDSDGEERGFGLDESHPDVAKLAALVELLGKVEHQAVLQLQRKMRAHPLGPWVKEQKGVGEKQAARLLAVIGDPYWNTLYDRPRTVSELWAYCGLHVLPAGQSSNGTQGLSAGGDSSPTGGDSGHAWTDNHGPPAGVAARRRKGQKANWSTAAKTRAYLIAESMLRAGNRDIYDKRKANTEGRIHTDPCVRCGPKGKPALPGSPWSDGHRHADALRIQSKELLKNLWREAKRLHEET